MQHKNSEQETAGMLSDNEAVSALIAVPIKTHKIQWIKARKWYKFMLVRKCREVNILYTERLNLAPGQKSTSSTGKSI